MVRRAHMSIHVRSIPTCSWYICICTTDGRRLNNRNLTLFVLEMKDGLQCQLPQVGGVLSARSGEVASTARGSGGSRGIIPHARQQHQRQEGVLGRLLQRRVHGSCVVLLLEVQLCLSCVYTGCCGSPKPLLWTKDCGFVEGSTRG